MIFFNRISLFGLGFFLGLMILMFIWGQKGAQFNYGPQARVKNSLLSKTKIEYQTSSNNRLADCIVRQMINDGKVIFSESITNRDSCNLYHIEYQKKTYLELENCKDQIVVKKMSDF